MSILRLFLLLLQFAFLFIGIIYFIFSRDLPKIETITEIKLTNPMRIYASDNELIGLFGTEKRQIVKFDEIPDNVNEHLSSIKHLLEEICKKILIKKKSG